MELVGVLFGLLLAAALLYVVIRLAVRHALTDALGEGNDGLRPGRNRSVREDAGRGPRE